MNVLLGNLELKDVVEDSHLEKIQRFLSENGFQRETVCANVANQPGNYHIYDIPRQIHIAGKEKMDEFISFLKKENLVAEGFKGRVGLTYV